MCHGWEQPQAHVLLRVKQVLYWLEGQQVLTNLSSCTRSLSLGRKRVKDWQQLRDAGSNARTAEMPSLVVPKGTTLAFIPQSNSGQARSFNECA